MIFQGPFQPGPFCNPTILKEWVCPSHHYPVPHIHPHSIHARTETFTIKGLGKKPGLGRDSFSFGYADGPNAPQISVLEHISRGYA